MNIIELIRRDNEHPIDRFDRVDELGSARGKPSALGFAHHAGRWVDPDDFEASDLLLPFLFVSNSREVSLEDLDDRLAVDQWLRETARG